MVIKAFVAGLEDDELPFNSVSRGATTSRSRSGTHDIVSESCITLDQPPHSPNYLSRFHPASVRNYHKSSAANNLQEVGQSQPSELNCSNYCGASKHAASRSYLGPLQSQQRSYNHRSGNRGTLHNHPGFPLQ